MEKDLPTEDESLHGGMGAPVPPLKEPEVPTSDGETAAPPVTEASEPLPDETVHHDVEPMAGEGMHSTPVPGMVASAMDGHGTHPSPIRRFLSFLKRHRLPVLLVCAFVLLAAAGAADWWYLHRPQGLHPVSRFTAVVTPFKVVSTVPAAGQSGITNANKIIVNFSRPVDATKLAGDFFTSPTVSGTYSQGANSEQAVFTPGQPFASGTAVKVMVHGEFQSQDGTKLGADFSFGFTTASPDDGVEFTRSGFIETLGSTRAGTSQTYSIMAGANVSTNNTVTVYKSTVQQLLGSLTYTERTTDGYSYQTFVNQSVDTSGLASVATKTGLKDSDTFQFTPDKGVYVLVATNQGKQVGFAWLVASNFGVIVRQDDQQAIFAAEDYASGSPLTADIALYHLSDTVQQLATTNITGVGTVKLPLSPSLDVAVATSGDDTTVVPVATYLTLADIRAQKDLSTSSVIYGLTDKPTYNPGETIHYAGFIRTDNDAAYTAPTSKQMQLYVAADATATHNADATATVSPNGQISAAFTVGAGAIPDGQQSQQLFVYNGSATNSVDADSPVGAFTVTSQSPAAETLGVQFAKSDYLASDTIAATIVGTKADGTPLAGRQVTVNVFAKSYYENDIADNLTSFGSTGDQVNDNPMTVTLDGSGRATVPIDVSKFPAGSSQVATVQASVVDANGVTAGGGASAVIHEGDGVLEFGPSRTVIAPGGQIIGRIYAKTLNDKPLSNTQVSYTVSANQGDSTKQIASGTATTDSTGYAQVTQSIGSYPAGTSFTLTASTADAYNNKITASTYYYIQSSDGSVAYSDVQLSDLDIAGAPAETSVGQTLDLTINAPSSLHALVTLERGRIHSYKMVDLSAGPNSYTLPITPDLAPSFSLIFSYFQDGNYHNEGVTFDVAPLDKQASVQLNMPTTASAGQTVNVGVSVNDSTGQQTPGAVIVGAVSANVFNLNNQVTPDIFAYFYSPRGITTNASSSLVGIGSGGGKCGGGGFDQPALLNPLGTVAAWQPLLVTDANGRVNTQLQLPKGTWRVYAYTMGSDGAVGSTYSTVVSQ